MIEAIKALEEEKKTFRSWLIFPEEKKLVGCKRVVPVKYKPDGSVERYKAHLIAKGYTQIFDIDYQETFARVAKMNSIKVLISLTVNQN